METTTKQKLTIGSKALNFEAKQMDGSSFDFASLKGKKILLSFLRNGACAMCNLRVHELVQQHDRFEEKGIQIVTVFESPVEDMIPYVAKQHPPFLLLSDANGSSHEKYGLETSEEKIAHVMMNNLAADRIKEAAAAGFALTKQEGSNFYRLPADFLIDENFVVRKLHYSDFVIDHMPIAEILA